MSEPSCASEGVETGELVSSCTGFGRVLNHESNYGRLDGAQVSKIIENLFANGHAGLVIVSGSRKHLLHFRVLHSERFRETLRIDTVRG